MGVYGGCHLPPPCVTLGATALHSERKLYGRNDHFPYREPGERGAGKALHYLSG